MATLLAEIKRRKVFQVAAVYAVTAWLLVQVVTAISDPLNLPEWADALVIVLLAIGFPIALILSWAYNITSGGVVRERGNVSDKQSGKSSIWQRRLKLVSAPWPWHTLRSETRRNSWRSSSFSAIRGTEDQGIGSRS